MKKSKNSTLLRQISELEAEVSRLRESFHNNMVLFHDVRKKESALTGVEFYRNKYLQMLYGHKRLQEACGFAPQSPEERRVIKRISRRDMRREYKRVISEGLVDLEQDVALMAEDLAFNDMYAESLREFMEWEMSERAELEERYEEWSGVNDDWTGPDDWDGYMYELD